jgi:hypothetical protein
MDLRDIYITCNRDRLLDMYDELKDMCSYTSYLDLPSSNSSDLIETISDNLVFVDGVFDEDDDYTVEDYYNFET